MRSADSLRTYFVSILRRSGVQSEANLATLPRPAFVAGADGTMQLVNSLGSAVAVFSGTAAGGDYVQLISSEAGSGTDPEITTAGADTNIGLTISTKGNGSVAIGGGSATGAGTGGGVTTLGGTGGTTGDGGAVALTGGLGGSTSGAGGAASLNGGAAQGGNSAGGAVSGTAGPGSGTSAGGAVTFTGGTGGATGTGGAVKISGGFGGATSGAGGALNLNGGDATAGNSNGGAATLTAGAATGTGTGGALNLNGGGGGAGTGDGGAASVTAGDGATAGGAGGALSITAGSAQAGGSAGGGTTIRGGNGSVAGLGGTITLRPGNSSVAANRGSVKITDQAGTTVFSVQPFGIGSGHTAAVAISPVSGVVAGTTCNAPAGTVTFTDSNTATQVLINNSYAAAGGMALVSFASTTGLAATTAVRSVVVGAGTITVTVTAAFNANNAVLSFFLLNPAT